MISLKRTVALIISAALIAAPALASRVHRAPTSGSTHGHRKAVKTHKLHGQQSIDPERATEIQQALIREHYLSGDATGRWDATTETAMQKYQADQGWQTRLMPDSRALKKLGLGPDYSSAINAKDSSFGAPPSVGTTTSVQAAGFAAASGVAP